MEVEKIKKLFFEWLEAKELDNIEGEFVDSLPDNLCQQNVFLGAGFIAGYNARGKEE